MLTAVFLASALARLTPWRMPPKLSTWACSHPDRQAQTRAARAGPLFAITTAYVTLETALAVTTRGTAAIVFQSLATADFRTIVTDAEAVVRATATDTGTAVETSEDSYGFSWLVLRLGSGRPGGPRPSRHLR